MTYWEALDNDRRKLSTEWLKERMAARDRYDDTIAAANADLQLAFNAARTALNLAYEQIDAEHADTFRELNRKHGLETPTEER